MRRLTLTNAALVASSLVIPLGCSSKASAPAPSKGRPPGDSAVPPVGSNNPRYQGMLLRQTMIEEANAKGMKHPTGDQPVFTTDWISPFQESMLKHLGHLKGKPNVKFLEIGSFEGRSAI